MKVYLNDPMAASAIKRLKAHVEIVDNAEDEAVFDLTGEILAGDFPKKQAAYVKAWCLLHEEELQANWKLAKNGEEVYRIEPLH